MIWAIICIIITGSIVAMLETPYLIKNKMFRELSFFSVILTVGIALSILQALRIPIPNPLDLIAAIHKPVSDLILGMLE